MGQASSGICGLLSMADRVQPLTIFGRMKGAIITLGQRKYFLKWFPIGPQTEGYQYEVRVYETIISPLNRICPFFVQFAAAGICQSGEIAPVDTQYNKKNLPLQFLATTYGGSRDLQSILSQLLQQENSESVLYAVKILILQVALALHCLGFSRTMHNDLHFGNVLVEHSEMKASFQYQGIKPFSLTSPWTVSLFDWDYAFSDALGPNPFLNQRSSESPCHQLNRCNKFVPNKDLAFFLCFGLTHFPQLKLWQQLLMVPAPLKPTSEECFLRFSDEDFSHFPSPAQVAMVIIRELNLPFKPNWTRFEFPRVKSARYGQAFQSAEGKIHIPVIRSQRSWRSRDRRSFSYSPERTRRSRSRSTR